MPFSIAKTQHFLSVLNDIAVLFPALLIIFTWRGFMQAYIAKRVGDDTAQKAGFLTLNPLAHINLSGMLIIMLFFFFIGGIFYGVVPRAILFILLIMLGVRWTIPVPINESLFTNHRLGGIAMSVAGSMGNFLLAFLTIPIFKLTLWQGFPQYVVVSFVEIFRTIIDISLFFGVIDLIPFPPFDGGRLLRHALPKSAQHIVTWLEEYALFIFFMLFFVPGISDMFFGSIIATVAMIKKTMFQLFF